MTNISSISYINSNIYFPKFSHWTDINFDMTIYILIDDWSIPKSKVLIQGYTNLLLLKSKVLIQKYTN
jgi:hypothetical protein